MRLFSRLLPLACPALALIAGGPDGAHLDYRLKVRMREGSGTLESAFRMTATPALVTRNKVQRPRLGSWQIEPLAGRGAGPSPELLVRALGLCYFSGPTPQALPLATGMTLGKRWCRLWQVQTPPEVGAYVYLAEVAPGLLTLAYLSATLPDGDIRSLEIHLDRVSLGPRAAPSEEGTALLNTLRHWAEQARNGGDPATLETEAVP